jgi:hypothetical protein
MPRARGQDRDLIYLLQLAKKHNLATTTLHGSLLSARRRGRARCEKLQVEIRSRGADSSTYMFSVNGKPLSQAVIHDYSIEKLKKLPIEYSSILEAERNAQTNGSPGAPIKSEIGKMHLGQNGLSFKAHVVRKSEVRAVTTRDGTPLLVCSVMLSDGTGQIPLAVWNSQISTVSEGDLVEVQNARVRSFRGEKQLALSKKTGLLTVLEPALTAKS